MAEDITFYLLPQQLVMLDRYMVIFLFFFNQPIIYQFWAE